MWYRQWTWVRFIWDAGDAIILSGQALVQTPICRGTGSTPVLTLDLQVVWILSVNKCLVRWSETGREKNEHQVEGNSMYLLAEGTSLNFTQSYRMQKDYSGINMTGIPFFVKGK
jgi:hypothetical protein